MHRDAATKQNVLHAYERINTCGNMYVDKILIFLFVFTDKCTYIKMRMMNANKVLQEAVASHATRCMAAHNQITHNKIFCSHAYCAKLKCS